jgi:hypothetical protein
MLEIILLIFLCKKIGEMAINKGLNPRRWKFYTIISWIIFEMLGCVTGMALFGFDKNNLLELFSFSILCAFGGFLLVRFRLENLPNQQ